MLFPRSNAWTLRQKRLIVVSAVMALAAFSALVYGYERYYRGPGQEVLYGTWHSSACIDCTFDLTLFPNHTFISSGESMGRYGINDTGTWYADFNRIFLQRRDADEHALVIMKLSDVTGKELKISHSDWVETWTRGKTMTREEIERMVGKADYTSTP